MIKRFRLGLKFSLMMGLVFILSILLSTVLVSRTAQASAQAQVRERAVLMMETMNSVRAYTNNQISPIIYPTVDTDNFVLEAIPAYAARAVFEKVQGMQQYSKFSYKEAAFNPTNAKHIADEFEATILDKFRTQTDLQELSGFRKIGGESLFYIARPLTVSKESCLQCHSRPEVAPKRQVEIYGPDRGFDWQLNEIIASQIMYVPASEIFASYRHQFSIMMGIFILSFLVVLLLINWLLRRNVIKPIIPMARAAQKISDEQLSGDAAEERDLQEIGQISHRSDEIGQLAKLFKEMVESVQSREENVRQSLNRLRFETDESKQLSMLKEITESLNTKRLIEKSQSIRNRFGSN